MKKICWLFIGTLISLVSLFGTNSFAAWWGNYWTAPSEVLDRVVWEANVWSPVQDTKLDRISDTNWQFATQYKLTNTLDSIRQEIAPYLQWFMFIGLSVATVMIIITGFQLVTSVQSGADTKKAAWRIKNIAIGIIVMTWFYIITRLFMSLVAYVLQ